MLISKDVYVLINFVSFADNVFMALAVTSLFVLRWTQPNMHRPIKVCSAVIMMMMVYCGGCGGSGIPLRTLHLSHISSLMLAWYKEGTVSQVLSY